MKAAQEVSKEVFRPLFEKIWDEEEVPSDWREGGVHCKTSQERESNYRGIMLL